MKLLSISTRLLAPVTFAAMMLAATAAHAHGAGRAPAPTISDLPDGPLKNRLQDVKQRSEKEGHAPSLVEHPFREALRAAERSRGAGVAGDAAHAGQLTALAQRWVRVASTLVRAASAERAAQKAEKDAVDLTSKLERAELLLAEQQSRLARAKMALRKLQERVEARKRDVAAQEKARTLGKQPAKARNKR